MISYRKLAMRVLGHPLRVPTPPRPASHRVTALALTAAMVAGMAAPAYADVYYIGDGDITITKDENGTQVQQGNSTKNDTDRDIVIKGGTNPANTASGGSSSGSNSSKSTTLAKSPAKSMSATPPSEDSDSENEDKVYLGDTKGGGEENENQTGGTTGGEKNETDFTKKTQPSRSPVLESQITYTGPSLKVADANDDEETRDESTTALKTAAENFRNTAENVTNYVIRIINKVKDSTLNVTLEDVNIKANNDAALSVEGAGNTTITLKGDNTLTSDGKHAGLEHNEKSDGGATTGKLTITSETDKNGNNTSSLTATGSGGSAGIGSAWSKSGSSTGAGTIEIVGGDIKAIGASSAAGIGSGYGATSDTDIIISGTAKIEAESTYGGAGIGSGKNSTGETNIIIKSGTITKATGGKYGGAGIGSGSSDTKDDSKKGVVTINITGGTITEATGGSDYVSSSKRWYSGAGIGSGTYRDGTADNEKGAVTINIKDNAHIVSATGGSDSTSGGAGIGGGLNSGKSIINILKGTIGNVIGGRFAAGIGSGQSSKSEVNISGGTLQTVTGGACGAGIGGGFDGSSSDVTITGGTLQIVTGGAYGAGIGSGYYGGSSTVNISGNAKLKNVTGGEDGGAGIGSGYSSSSSSVTISGGTVNAAGNQYSTSGSSGIGGNSTDVTISGGNITATGYGTGAGIGSYDDNSSNITITGGTITATGNDKAPAIGNGSVSISNADAPLDITATAPVANKAIQSSDGKTLDDVIRLKENDTLGLVTLVESGTYSISRLFHNGFYAANVPSFHSPNRVEAEMSEAEKAQYGDISSVHNWKVSNREDPTCGKDGYIDYICMVGKCGATFRHTLPATGQHTWNEGVVTKEPTCTELGVRTFTCTVCHNTRTEDIEAPGHEYGEWVIDRDATCIEEGSKHRDCIRSDATQTEVIPATGQHQWKVLSTTAATCGQDGTVTYQCEVCNETKTETLNATGQHSYGAGVVTKAATCAEPGIMTYTCVVCNDSYTESIPVDKSTHKWDAGVVTKEPTCTADGVRTFTCSVCGDTRTEAIKALGHEYGEWVIDRDATCVEEGSKHRDCIRGDDTQTEVIPVSKTHTFGEWVITKEPTCTEKGERQHSCTISGCVVTETEELPALGHQWSDWTPVKGDSSREYRICEVCNEVEYRDVSHNSDSSISTGLRVLDPAQTNIIQNVQLVQLSQINHTLYIYVAQETASLQGDLSDLIDLRSENIETVVFSTESCTSTLSLSDVAALGAGSTPFILSHSGSTATFTVGGADHTALLR